MSLVIFIAILVALIWVHELGHFSVAKFFKVRVDEFAIGFPPRLLTVQWGETRYSFNLLLIGGYVKIYGEDPGEGDDPRSLARKNRGIQALVMVAGVAFNIIFAWMLLTGGYVAGLPAAAGEQTFGTVADARTTVAGVVPRSPAAQVGVKERDVIVGAETASARLDAVSAEAVRAFVAAHPDETVLLHVERSNEPLTFAMRPSEGLVPGRKVIGVDFREVGTLRLPAHLAAAEAAIKTKEYTVAMAVGLAALIGGALAGTADLGQVAGPIGIAAIGNEAVQTSATATLMLAVILSINLAIVNLLPIPGLDGGRLFILLIESIIRRPIAPHLVTKLTLAGFAFILVIFVLVSIQDISRLVE